MFQAWRRKIRAAETAFRAGQWEQAAEILAADHLQEFLPGKQLAQRIAEAMLEQAKTNARQGESSAGWRLLDQAARLVESPVAVEQVRAELVKLAVAEIERLLATGEPHEALVQLDQLERRHRSTATSRTLRRVAEQLRSAERLCRQGKFAEAETCYARAESLRPEWKWLAERRAACQKNLERSRRLSHALYQTLEKEQWREALATAEALLELAPENSPAHQVRARAWRVVGLQATLAMPTLPRAYDTASTNAPCAAEGETVRERKPGPRLLLWVDAVGGYLVCLGEEVVLGIASPERMADVPILGNLSRRHAVIRRDGGGYLLDPLRPVRLDGQPCQRPATLTSGQIIELGESVKLRFERPHPLSSTAQLLLVSRHKFEPTVDRVLLMSESLVLGPGGQNHILCQHWDEELVLFRQGERLFCRRKSPYEVDGQRREGKAEIRYNSQIAGQDFALSFEPLVEV